MISCCTPPLPVAPGHLIRVPQIVRGTVPISTRPNSSGGYDTGLGDTNLFDIFLLHDKAMQIGVGPLLTMPTATDRSLGTGKWQAGLAGVVVDPSPARRLGALVQWQHSFAGQGGRPDVQSLTVQPFSIFNLPRGWYIRSTGTWSFDLQRGDYYVPVGLGAGKAWKEGSTIFNAFIEPQYSVLHEGSGLPQWTIFAGLNMTFGKQTDEAIDTPAAERRRRDEDPKAHCRAFLRYPQALDGLYALPDTKASQCRY